MTGHGIGGVPHLPAEAIQVARALEASERPVLTSHIRLDGDAIGAELGLAHILTAMGKRPLVVNDSRVPKVFEFLPRVSDFLCQPLATPLDGGPLAILDTPTRSRVQAVLERLPADAVTLLIDHHQPCGGVAQIEWVDTAYSSAGEMVAVLARARGWPLPREAATCLYVAIVTDTGRFTFPNTRALTFGVCQDLIQTGADHRLVSEELYQKQDMRLLKLRAEAIQGIRLCLDGRVASMRLTREMLRRHGVDPIDTQEFADIPRSLNGVEVGLMLREMDEQPGKVKASMRSHGGVDVAAVARGFGGGGHTEAAGCELEGSLDDVEARVLDRIAEALA